MESEELVGVFLSSGCLTQYQCPNCRFIYRDFRWESCRKCDNALITRSATVYSTAAYGYLLAISALIKTKLSNEEKERAAIIDRVRTDFDIRIEWDELIPLANELREIMGKPTQDPKGNYRRHVEAHPKMVRYIKDRFGISDDSVAGRFYGVVLNYQGSYELDGPIVILAVTLIETLFDHFLLELAGLRGEYDELKGDIFKEGWVFSKRKRWFKSLTDIKLDDYLVDNGWGEYTSISKAVKERRNKFVHGFWMSIGEDTLIDALRCAGASFDLIIELNNEFCVRTE